MISIRHLSKTFKAPDGKSLQVLKDVNCEISKGEVISIIGPSGTGKSTFLRALNLLDPPTGGEILFEGEDILRKGYPVNRLRQRMGMPRLKQCNCCARWVWLRRRTSIHRRSVVDRNSVWLSPVPWRCIRR